MPAGGQQSHVNPFLFDYLITTHHSEYQPMKIISAAVNKGPSACSVDTYVANVRVSSDAKEHAGIGYGDEPNEAMHKAIAEACAKFTQPLHDSVKLAIEVKF